MRRVHSRSLSVEIKRLQQRQKQEARKAAKVSHRQVKTPSYKQYGGLQYNIGKVTNKSIEKFVELNRSYLTQFKADFEARLRSFIKSGTITFTPKGDPILAFVKTRIRAAGYTSIQEAIKKFFAPENVRDQLYIFDLVTATPNTLQELQMQANEKMKLEGFSYKGSGTWFYTADNGTTVKVYVDFTNSPLHPEIID